MVFYIYEKKTKKFIHLSKDDRNEIKILLNKKYSQRAIATTLKRSNSTISEEIKQGSTNGVYDPKKAHHKAYVRRYNSKYQAMKIVEHKELQDFIKKGLYDGQSPENIAGRIRNKEKHLPSIGKDAIYTFIASIYGRKIEYSRSKNKKKIKSGRQKVTKLKDRVFIDKRPSIINKRERVGDVEADFIVSGKNGKGILLTVVDRKIRVSFIEQILDVSIRNVEKSFKKIQKRFPEMKTITTENASHFVYLNYAFSKFSVFSGNRITS